MDDNVNKPKHYQGKYGMESIEIIDNFIGDLKGKAAWSWGIRLSTWSASKRKMGLRI